VGATAVKANRGLDAREFYDLGPCSGLRRRTRQARIRIEFGLKGGNLYPRRVASGKLRPTPGGARDQMHQKPLSADYRAKILKETIN